MTENVKVYLRIRPHGSEHSNATETQLRFPPTTSSLHLQPETPTVTITSGARTETFIYDGVGGPLTPQTDVFETVARPVTEYCLQGYNGTVFAYGQTGSGKTYTMQGPMTEEGLIDYGHRGLIPRTFEYLFECIRAEEETSRVNASDAAGEREFLCKCTYVEIYNEAIFDLLDPTGLGTTCTLREDIKRGVYIEGAREETLQSPAEAYEVYERGSLNRHVAETTMNRESSRSHSVFTLFIQSRQRVGEIVDVRESRFNLVDLAGSERQQLANTTGMRLKEAGNINRSLLALSNVINALVDISHGRPRHVQYRDSKLTFLLRDSLGGNARTVIVATVSGAAAYGGETLSTLKFAQRAKQIRNKAVVNKDIQGNVLQLQAEIQRLQHELCVARQERAEEGDVYVMGAKKARQQTPSPGGENGDGLDPAEAYLMLTMALERQAETSDELETLRSKVALLEEALRRRDMQHRAVRMVLKFRESALARLQNSDDGAMDSVGAFDEHAALRREVAELRRVIEHHPEVTRFAYENLQLRERLYRYEALERRASEFDSAIARHRQYEQLLTSRLLVLERSRMLESPSDESIPLQAIDEEAADGGKEKAPGADRMTAPATMQSSERDVAMDGQDEDGGKHAIETGCETDGNPLLDPQAPLKARIAELDAHIGQLTAHIGELDAQNVALTVSVQTARQEAQRMATLLETEQRSVLRLVGEKETLSAQMEQLARANDRDRGHSRHLLQDYETAKGQFSLRVTELEDELSRARGEVDAAEQRAQSAHNDRLLLQQELEVTRQVLAEHKSRTGRAGDSLASEGSNSLRLVELEGLVVSLEDRNKILHAETGQLQGKIGRLEFLLRSAQGGNDELMGQIGQLQRDLEEARTAKEEDKAADRETAILTETKGRGEESDQLTALDAAKIHLEAANHTIATLRGALAQVEADASSLRVENDKLLQHHNLKQKLQYHVRIKQENNELQEELTRCRDELRAVSTRQEAAAQFLAELRKTAAAVPGGKAAPAAPSSMATAERIMQLIRSMPASL